VSTLAPQRSISADHPLRRLFRELVWRRYVGDTHVADPQIADYVADLLTDFTHVDSLYRVRDARGRRLEEVGEMLLASNPLLAGRSFDYEREVRKHIGDFTLFFTGLFPEWLDSLPRRRQIGIDALVDYVRAGKESYAIVSEFNLFEYADEAPLYRRLADTFELCVFGLNLVKQDLERLHGDALRRWRSVLSDRSLN
jgi:hypothetical protein